MKLTGFVLERKPLRTKTSVLNSPDAHACLKSNLPLLSKLRTPQDDYMASVAVLASPAGLLKSHL